MIAPDLTQFNISNITFPNWDPAIDHAIWEGGLMDFVPKQECLQYLHQNCTWFGTALQLGQFIAILIFTYFVLRLIKETKSLNTPKP